MQINVPGKVMICGEWSITQLGNSCIAASVNKYATATINTFSKIKITFTNGTKDLQYSSEALFDNQILHLQNKPDQKLHVAIRAIETTLQFLLETNCTLKPFDLTIDTSEFYTKTGKFGVGSSGASLIAIVAAVLKFHNSTYNLDEQATRKKIFKLACIADISIRGISGSYYDFAASTFGAVVEYSIFDRDWLFENKNKKPSELINKKWPGLKIQSLPDLPAFLIVYSNKEANTRTLISQYNLALKLDPVSILRIFKQIQTSVAQFKTALTQNNEEQMQTAIAQNREFLLAFEKQIKITLETPELAQIISIAQQHHAQAKFSGAGGGDIAIIFPSTNTNIKKLKQECSKKYPILDLSLDKSGVHLSR